jgi:hypothetical protein
LDKRFLASAVGNCPDDGIRDTKNVFTDIYVESSFMETSLRYVFLLGGMDLEMSEIKNLLSGKTGIN